MRLHEVSQTRLEISARAEIHPGLKLSPCKRKRLFKKICPGGRDEMSAQLTNRKIISRELIFRGVYN